jgi:hypothetical protein
VGLEGEHRFPTREHSFEREVHAKGRRPHRWRRLRDDASRRARDLVVCSEATDTFLAVSMADAAMPSTLTVAREYSDVVMLSSAQRSSRA